jgi:hypothetical protein
MLLHFGWHAHTHTAPGAQPSRQARTKQHRTQTSTGRRHTGTGSRRRGATSHCATTGGQRGRYTTLHAELGDSSPIRPSHKFKNSPSKTRYRHLAIAGRHQATSGRQAQPAASTAHTDTDTHRTQTQTHTHDHRQLNHENRHPCGCKVEARTSTRPAAAAKALVLPPSARPKPGWPPPPKDRSP